jgi:hypothetical protein
MTYPARFLRFGFDMMALGAESSGVMALRMMKLAAGGPAATVEAQLMVAEKMQAAAEAGAAAWTDALTGASHGTAQRTLVRYRRKVRANRRRLSRVPKS